MNIIESQCDECECESETHYYQVFNVKEWLCDSCFVDFIGEEE